ncbi:efflux RND transporter permease subunit [Motilimonas eburnea]|uniref:efflux RND transporter permease subunit n=1 Tax=Motilimonas eburnea TaxID=1737488 RepID=UPI001E60BFF3|nr:efflux RND transporter permease subunit [Motilimonas eburnea]MCE2570486.1 efflux RND transporter permease subunit [Motilimonas eburnea]
MSMTSFSLNNSRITLFLIAVLTFLGIQAFNTIPEAYDPGFTIRSAQVITQFPGASPKRVEELVSDPLEKAVLELAELDYVKSQSKNGVSILTVAIKDEYSELQPIWDKLRRKIERAAIQLPEGVGTPVVNDEFGDVFGIVLAIHGEGFSYRELKQTAEDLRSGLFLLDDVAKVDLHGVQQEQIKLKFDANALATYELTPNQLADMLAKQNIVLSGGNVAFGQERLPLEPSGNYVTPEEINGTLVTLPNSGKTVRLDTLVTIESGYEFPVNNPVSFSGTPSVNVAIAMVEGGNNVRLGDQVNDYIDAFSRTLPLGLEISKVYFAPIEVEEKVNQFVLSLVQSMLVVGLVMFIFLGWRTGLIVSLLIPISMLTTILVMSKIGLGLDQISLAALIIALGMLVDNGIVMSENILVRFNQGVDKVTAAIDSANELKFPLLTSSLTTSAAFLPIYLAQSNMGEYTGALFVVVSITLLASWVLSLVLIPLLCVLLLKQTEPVTLTRFTWYANILKWVIRYRWLTMGTMAIVTLIGFQAMKLIPTIFFPPSERNFFKMEVTLPMGTSIEHSQEVVADIEQFLSTLSSRESDDAERQITTLAPTNQGINSWSVYVGYSGPRYILPHSSRTSSPEYSFWIINTHDYRDNPELMQRIEAYVYEHHPDAIATTRLIENGAAILNPVEIRINGVNQEKVLEITQGVKAKLASIAGLKDMTDDWGQKTKTVRVIIDQQKAALAGVSNRDIALSLQSSLVGKNLSEFRDGIVNIPIVLTHVDREKLNIEHILALPIYTPTASIALSQIADVDIVWQNAKIYRRNSYKTVTIGAQLEPGYTANEGLNAILPWLEAESKTWPSNTFFEIGGEFEKSKQSSGSISENIPLALFAIIALLIAQFNSFRKPLIVLTAIPISFIGVVVGLLVGNSFFGFMTLLGVISLAGIVINNAIVFLEQVDIELGSSQCAVKALISAGERRMKPILLTALTTVLGMIPLLLTGGAMWQTMAIAIIAGLIFSTLLTLILVPVLYSIFYRVEVRD